MPRPDLVDLLRGIEAVLFDLDGTLVHTNIDFPHMKREMIRLAAAQNIPVEEAAPLDILAIVEKIGLLSEVAKQEALGVLENIELQCSAKAEPVEGAAELLEALRERGVKVGIVTRNCRAASVESLERTGITPDVLLCREDVVRTKPAPDHLLAALETLSADAETSLMVGDHLMDITAGKRAGMRTLAVLTPDRPRDFFDAVGPDAVVTDLEEIKRAVIHNHC